MRLLPAPKRKSGDYVEGKYRIIEEKPKKSGINLRALKKERERRKKEAEAKRKLVAKLEKIKKTTEYYEALDRERKARRKARQSSVVGTAIAHITRPKTKRKVRKLKGWGRGKGWGL